MRQGPNPAEKLRLEAWAYGRGQREALLQRYCEEYDLSEAPPPALVIDELMTDFLDIKLRFDPLPPDRFAQTRVVDGITVVTVNSLTAKIRGVKDAMGVQNVGKWHELIHVLDDQAELRHIPQNRFPGFEEPPVVVCMRSGDTPRSGGFNRREFWAEEAGRAAAVSYPALARSPGFRRFVASAVGAHGEAIDGWHWLYRAAEDIGVNISALVKQLQLDGRLALVRADRGPNRLFITPAFADLSGGIW